VKKILEALNNNRRERWIQLVEKQISRTQIIKLGHSFKDWDLTKNPIQAACQQQIIYSNNFENRRINNLQKKQKPNLQNEKR